LVSRQSVVSAISKNAYSPPQCGLHNQ